MQPEQPVRAPLQVHRVYPVPYIKLLRPLQWLKNLMIFFPPFLGGVLLQPGMAMRGVLPFLSFCMVSSATYILNDIFDCDNDRHHPEKCERPLPSGRVSTFTALALAAALALGGAYLARAVASPLFLILLGVYVSVSLAYSFRLKEYVIVDILCISAGFLVRLEAGGEVFGLAISNWLFACVFLLSVFLSAGKRLGEKHRLGQGAGTHRKALAIYTPGVLKGIMYLTGGAVLVTYGLYMISCHSLLLVYSIPLCGVGLLRFMFRVQSGRGGDPTESLLRDAPLLIVGISWALLVGWGLYGV